MVWKTIELLNGSLYALVLGAVCVLFSVLLRINMLYQPNTLDVLLWTTLYFTLVHYIKSENPKWLYAAAVSFALGFLNKYNIAFLVMGFLPALLLTPHRKVLANKHVYFSMGLALLLISPNLVWQYTHDFPVVQHMNELARTQLVNVQRLDFLKEQLIFFIGSFYVIVAAWVSFFTYRPFATYRIFFWAYVFTLGTFIILKAKGYYAIGLYPILIAFGVVYLEYLLQAGWRRYLRPLALFLPILVIIRLFPVIFPTASPAEIHRNSARYESLGLLRWEDGKNHYLPQDFADMLGWKELAHKVDSASALVEGKGRTLILTDNYGQAGAINFYSKNKNHRAVSLNADYIDWIDLSTKIDHLVLIQEASDTDKGREREKPFFEKIRYIGKIEDQFAREKGTSIYLLENARVDINKILRQEIRERKHGND
ncbi:glycosyltransferase family 39 protein [Salmonirosea aquatica]|uniref:glycosyltransferase family 39 protein n=1 Tax=Salmonirosea aquatica TaxID=2654236 RepID=UPI003570C51B